MTGAVEDVLMVAFRRQIEAPSAELGFEQLRAHAVGALDEDGFRDAIADCLRRGLIREPVRLAAGALQCHWRLELTPAGVAAARSLLAG